MEKLLGHISNQEIINGLKIAKEMISDPDYWLQSGYKKFDKRCAAQAMAEAANEEEGASAESPLFNAMSHRLLIGTGKFSIDSLNKMEDIRDHVCNFNDSNDHETVMRAFDEAITS